eukprot:Selendium_serpulae@DN4631_c0_g1_i1.p1
MSDKVAEERSNSNSDKEVETPKISGEEQKAIAKIKKPEDSEKKDADGVENLAKKLEDAAISSPEAKSPQSPAQAGESPGSSPAKKADDDDKEENPVVAALTPPQRVVLEELKDLQEKHLKLEEEYEKELLVLQAKYIKEYTPLYESRSQVLAKPPAQPGADPRGTPCLPNFWLEALRNSRNIEKMIQKSDEPILSYVTNIRNEWLDIDEQLGFRIIFQFAENPHFTNKELSKTFHLQRNPESGAALVLGDKILTDTDGTDISWNPGKDVSVEEVQKTQRHKRTQEKRTITQRVPAETFFNFFKKREIPSEDQINKLDRKEFDALEEEVENDVEVGCDIRDEIIPRAVSYFLGEVEGQDCSSYDGSDDDMSGDDDDDYDDKGDTDEDKAKPANTQQSKDDCKTQ